MIVRAQVGEKAIQPRAIVMLVGPSLRVGLKCLKARAAELEPRVHAMQGIGKLHVERAIVFRSDVLPVRFFAQLDPLDRKPTRAQVTNLGRADSAGLTAYDMPMYAVSGSISANFQGTPPALT